MFKRSNNEYLIVTCRIEEQHRGKVLVLVDDLAARAALEAKCTRTELAERVDDLTADLRAASANLRLKVSAREQGGETVDNTHDLNNASRQRVPYTTNTTRILPSRLCPRRLLRCIREGAGTSCTQNFSAEEADAVRRASPDDGGLGNRHVIASAGFGPRNRHEALAELGRNGVVLGGLRLRPIGDALAGV